MTGNPFYKLAPFIQEYIWRNKWENLRDIQTQAIHAILDSSDHMLISSGTASGKTEAALLPVITDLYDNPPQAIGAVYIGPLKALINDQFERLTELLEASDIPVQSWHGDVAQTKKARFLQRARGILQITPESLEAMLINRHHELKRLFHDTRYIIIDEVHAFIDSDRGRQVMCQLERLSRLQAAPARRIGLSATIGEPQLAIDWLRGDTEIPVQSITSEKTSPVEIGLEYFLLPSSRRGAVEDAQPLEATKEARSQEAAYLEHQYKMTRRVPKTLIFANSRAATEAIIMNMRRIAARRKDPNFYHVHHGSISAPYREAAEAAMKDERQYACTAATVTLELGIDLGQLDQVIQVNSTHSVSSFVQRLGRSGRRGGPSRMFFYSTEQEEEALHIGKELPWNLLQTIAVIQLYAEEKWIEPPQIPQMPLSLLYHQTMSIIKSHSELSPPQIAERVLTLSAFRHITQDHFRRMLRHLLEIEHLEQTERGGLIIGVEAERIINNYRFYAVFCDEVEYRVRDKSREIGTIQGAPEVDSSIVLAGYAWQVLKVDEGARIIEVKRIKGRPATLWRGDGPPIHTSVLRKIRQILLSENSYPYLKPGAVARLQRARDTAKSAELAETSILPLTPNSFLILPFCGTRQARTQLRLLEHAGVKCTNTHLPYYYELECDATGAAEVKSKLEAIRAEPPAAAELPAPVPCQCDRYADFVPKDLLDEAYALDCTDIPGALESIKRL
ncbi:MAG: DEAD/DEAH box helicase [Chloroflexi bacterium]|nr:DEAD/DEAH box helicase [Chloroflexota bacterium]